MSEQPDWIAGEESLSMLKWTEYLYEKGANFFMLDGAHANILFSFKKEQGLISADLIPPTNDHDEMCELVRNIVEENDLYGVIFIGEIWMYCSTGAKDHTLFQLLDGEMRVADLNDKDKREALMVRMENKDGYCITYSNEFERDDHCHFLTDKIIVEQPQRNWFLPQTNCV